MQISSLQLSDDSGLSLIELMIVVAIIGILASMAIPRFQSFQAKAKILEGDLNLKTMAMLSNVYYATNDRYSNEIFVMGRDPFRPEIPCNTPNEIGFKLSGCDRVRFSYSYESAGANRARMLVESVDSDEIYPGCDLAIYRYHLLESGELLVNQLEAYGNGSLLGDYTFAQAFTRLCI